MQSVVSRSVLMMAVALTVTGCAADPHASLPEFMRAKAPDQPPPEPAPDVERLVRANLDKVFLATSYPRNMRVSEPHRAVRGDGWTACVRADLTSATGTPLGSQTYRLTIAEGEIKDRRRVGNEDNCVSEHYTSIMVTK
nr:hypothetical protein [Bradyrhizobium sp. STM 3843]